MKDALSILSTSFGWVALVVCPVVLLASFTGRRSPERRNFVGHWSAIEVIAFVCVFFLLETLCLSVVVQPNVATILLSPQVAQDVRFLPDANSLHAGFGGAPATAARERFEHALPIAGLWARLFAASAAVLLVLARRLAVDRVPVPRPTVSQVGFAGLSWLFIAPAVLGLNIIVTQFDANPDTHPLAKIGADRSLALLFLLSACVATPVFEELLVRGIILPWACRNRLHSVALWIPAGLFGVLSAKGHTLGLLVFFGCLVVGFWLLLTMSRMTAVATDRAAAVYMSSVLFAAAHASVWPSPIPLFVFSLALGWLTVRTGGITCAVIVHGLLNAVSAIYVLRGGPM